MEYQTVIFWGVVTAASVAAIGGSIFRGLRAFNKKHHIFGIDNHSKDWIEDDDDDVW